MRLALLALLLLCGCGPVPKSEPLDNSAYLQRTAERQAFEDGVFWGAYAVWNGGATNMNHAVVRAYEMRQESGRHVEENNRRVEAARKGTP